MVIHGFVKEQMEFWDYRKYGEYRKYTENREYIEYRGNKDKF